MIIAASFLLHEFIHVSGISVIASDEQCGRCVTEPTLFVMIHCDLPLYDNLLRANWPHLHRVTILGNSFDRYHTTNPSASLEARAPCLSRCMTCVHETEIPNTFTREVYSLDAVMSVPTHRVDRLPSTTHLCTRFRPTASPPFRLSRRHH